MYEYFGLMLEMQKILENPKMSFNGQPNMFFGKINFGLHLKLDILNPLNIFFLSNGLENESFVL